MLWPKLVDAGGGSAGGLWRSLWRVGLAVTCGCGSSSSGGGGGGGAAGEGVLLLRRRLMAAGVADAGSGATSSFDGAHTNALN